MLSVITCTKDEPLIGELVQKIKEVVPKAEIIIVDKSNAPPVFSDKSMKVIAQKSDGIGNAFIEGAEIAKGEYILLIDGDLQHDPLDIPLFLDAQSKGFDLVMGYKVKNEEALSRRIVSKVMNYIARKRLGLPYRDLMSGFFLVRKDILNQIKLNPKGYKILMEIAYKTKDMPKLKVAEVPITFHRRKAGESKVGFNMRGIKEIKRIWDLMSELKRGE